MVAREIRRTFHRNPVLTVVPILILTLGFAGSATAYTVMVAMSATGQRGLKPLSYATVAEEETGGGSGEVSWRTFEHFREVQLGPGTVLAAYSEPIRVRLQHNNQGREIAVAGVSSEFFPNFTEGTAYAGLFPRSWDSGGETGQIVLSLRLATELCGSSQGALGQTVPLGGHPYQVVAVAPADFSGLWSHADAWIAPDKLVTLTFQARRSESAQAQASPDPIYWKLMPMLYIMACEGGSAGARPSHAQLRERLDSLVKAEENRQFHLHVSTGLSRDPVQDERLRHWASLTLLIAGILMFAAAVNYAGLQLAQVPRQAEEVRLKRILGASAGRLMLEALWGPGFTVFAAFGLSLAISGLGAALLGKEALASLPAGSLGWRTLAAVGLWELLATILIAVCVSLAPALRLIRDQGTPRMGYTMTASAGASWAIRGLVAL